jgi:ABC-2 type transport system ATP-binding protein
MLATHNMAEVEAICDRVAIIDRGKVIAHGSPDELRRSLGVPALVVEVTPPLVDLDVFEGIEGVKGYTSSVDDERGVSTVQVVIEDDGAVEATRLVSRGMKVMASWRKQTTLEEVFVALVGRGFKEREEQDGS